MGKNKKKKSKNEKQSNIYSIVSSGNSILSNTNFIFSRHQDSLISAVKEGNIGFIRSFVEQNNLNFSGTEFGGYVLLQTAVKYQKSHIALWLLSNNCRVNKIHFDDYTNTPLHLAIQNNENLIIKMLLDKGAFVNAKNYKGETPLHISCQQNNISITKLLLSKDCDIADIPDACSTTPLHIATSNECSEIIKILLNHKVNVDAYTTKCDLKGLTPLHISILNKNEEIIKILLEKGANVDAIIENSHDDSSEANPSLCCIKYKNYKPLHLAVELDCNINILKLLIENGANVNSTVGDNSMLPLHISFQNNNKQSSLFLSEYITDFLSKTKDGTNILHLAVQNDWPEFVEVLISKGSDINDQTNDGETPLFMAVEMGNESMIEILLKYNADVDIQNSKNQSPLHIAAEFSANIVKILCDKSAYVDHIDHNNQTPLNIAVRQRHIDIVIELLHASPDINNISNKSAFIFALNNIAQQDMLEIVNLLVNYGFTIVSEDVCMNSIGGLINFCFLNGHSKIIDHIFENESNINLDCSNQDVNLLLHKTVLSDNISIAKLLIEHNCNLNIEDENGKTPLDYAIEHRKLNFLELFSTKGAKVLPRHLLFSAKNNDTLMIKFFLEHGANINMSDEFGTTVLHFGVWNRSHELVKFLLDHEANINTIRNSMSIATDKSNASEIDPYTVKFRKKILMSPLHIAVWKKCKDISSILLENHADINCRDGCGRTALHIASATKSVEQKDMIKMLMKYGADINVLDDFKKLPIYYIYNHTCVCSIAFQNQYEIYSECECDLYENYDINDVIIYYIKYIELLKSMNKMVHSDNLKLISESDFSRNLQSSCLQEISSMKTARLCDTISCYDIVTKELNTIVAYVRNEDVLQAFESSNYKNEFPIYWDMLEERFNLARERKQLLESATLSFNSLLHYSLPQIVLERIFKFLHLNDLHNITSAYNQFINSNISSRNDSRNSPKKLKACNRVCY